MVLYLLTYYYNLMYHAGFSNATSAEFHRSLAATVKPTPKPNCPKFKSCKACVASKSKWQTRAAGVPSVRATGSDRSSESSSGLGAGHKYLTAVAMLSEDFAHMIPSAAVATRLLLHSSVGSQAVY